MVANSFEIGDLVWAKMKGFPPWPGEIAEPPTNSSKVKSHYVHFYGTNNNAWIPDEKIILHNEQLVKLYGQKKKSGDFKSAVDKIVRESQSSSNSKYQQPYESLEERINEVPSLKFQKHSNYIKDSQDTSSKNSNVSRMKKKVPEKKIMVVKKRKRALSSDHSEAESSGFSMPLKKVNATKRSKQTASLDHNEADSEGFSSPENPRDESYANLIANIPPNIGYNGDTAPPSLGLLSRSDYVERPDTPPLDLTIENIHLKGRDIKPTTKKIGFLGLGKLGQGIVKNLLQSGHSVTVWNRTPEKCQRFLSIGAQTASTPADVVTASDITFCCVSNTDAAKELFYGNCGILKALETCYGQNKGYVEMTSMNPATSKAIAHEVADRGGRYLEASLNGSRLQAIEGTLFILGTGDKYLFDECESCFKAFARHAMFVGPHVGSASTFNIVHNMLFGTMCTALAESLALIDRSKLDPNQFLDMFQYGVLDSKSMFEKGKAMLNKEYTSNTPLKHMQKNFSMGLLLGNSGGQPMPVFAATNEAYKHLKLLRYAEHDVSSIYEGTRR